MVKLIVLFALIVTGPVFSQQLIPITKLFAKPQISNLDLSPNGDLILMTGHFKQQLFVSLINPTTEEVVELYRQSAGDTIQIKELAWLDNQNVILNLKSKSNLSSRTYRYIYHFKKDALSKTLKKKRFLANGHIVNPLENQTDKLLFASYHGVSKRPKLYATNNQSLITNNFKAQKLLTLGSENMHKYSTDAQLKLRFSQTFDVKNREVTHWLLDSQGDWQKMIAISPIEHDFKPVTYIDDTKVIALTNISSELIQLVEFNIESQTVDKIIYQHSSRDLHSAYYDLNNQLEYVSFYIDGIYSRDYIDSSQLSFAKKLAASFPNQIAYIVDRSLDHKKFLIYVSSSSNPGQYFLFDPTVSKAIKLGNRLADLDYTQFRKADHILIEQENGPNIDAFITQPFSSLDNKVLLVMPHGGPIGIADTRRFNPTIQFLVNRGYSVLQVNFRGSAGYGKSFKNAGRGEFGQLIEHDISLAVEHVRQHYDYDKACAIGASYGGYSSVMLSISDPEFYQCVIARFGIYDLPLLYNDSNQRSHPLRVKSIEAVVGKYHPDLAVRSPVYLVDKIFSPILITAGAKDEIARLEHSLRLEKVLQLKNKPHKSIYYTQAKHGHNKLSAARHEMIAIDQFIRKSLKLPPSVGENAEQLRKLEDKILNKGNQNEELVSHQF
ncbi:alpha/beta hydrolase family protein [Catenovulum maritimum]|uniref:Peptidase S9 prolyl oligopeptidase catalytic domain-containing protein n=1 Tax=Catenovulum maritimum TaxID=1513271 RepID=A0A0J8GVZ2_9ALTE|nr:prolyl oligopeptidase family serine peptidase [Catenovulum maritimum]KMT66950.1 hypothetical protein XM47_02305 [Catenovulum maritimum]